MKKLLSSKSLALAMIAGAMVIFGVMVLAVDPLISKPTISAPYVSSSSLHANQPLPVSRIEDAPEHIYIPSVGISLSVRRGYYDGARRTWLVPGNEAYIADGSSAPNNKSGTTYIYGHANKKAFLPLENLKMNDIAIVKGTNKSFYYKLVGADTTVNSDTARITKQGPPLLVLQTCTGPHFQYRAQYVFEFVRVS